MNETGGRGSTKLMHELFGGRAPETHEDVAKALGLSVERVKLLRWYLKGQPVPDWFYASVQVRPELVGEVAGTLIRNGLVVDGFPIGKPAIDAAILNISNLPLEARG